MQAPAGDALGAGLSDGARRALALWLGGCAGWVFSMVVLGGMTRLTRSGLSMTDWKFTGERAPGTQVRAACTHEHARLHASSAMPVTLCRGCREHLLPGVTFGVYHAGGVGGRVCQVPGLS